MTRPDEVSNEMLMALADGELDELEARHLRTRIAGDPKLAARFACFVETRVMVQKAYPAEPVPDRLIAAALNGKAETGPSKVIGFPRRLATISGWGAALAASVMLALGGFMAGRVNAPLPLEGDGFVVSTLDLATGDETRLPDGSTVRVLASFDTDMGLCRLFSQDDRRHVACRDPDAGGWFTALSVLSSETGDFLPASDLTVGLIDTLLDEIGAGPPLTIDEEFRALRE